MKSSNENSVAPTPLRIFFDIPPVHDLMRLVAERLVCKYEQTAAGPDEIEVAEFSSFAEQRT